ncbi:PhzF family phenazine biosynthesis protein [Micromonospora sp. WMMD710]|uniref:PhzF family phenazine biosynthesis protein n=1 Tax=Micromonospora sp. WMMD710 TaxID=3016085 RepID=UPI0024171DE6|nr:PhzF family phenazine biosynthesis protein [Micromonospora sp. WMMD710]MDG4758592.1 PhzF family phenazine biosynthesis protein [Micromonospora sp. WMMD710]
MLAALGVSPHDLATDDVPCVASPGTPRLLVPVRSLPNLLAMRPDLRRLAAECRRLGYLGCFVYHLGPIGGAATARMFAPAIGVDEDVVNANSTGCLAAHLFASRGQSRIDVEQGHTAGRPSSVFATASATPEGISARVGGMATIRSGPDGTAGGEAS